MTRLNKFGQAFSDSIPGASADGTRLNFSGFMDADFAQLVARNIFDVIPSSDGLIADGAISVDFLAADNAADIAARIRDAINNNTTVTAEATDSAATLTGGA